MDVQERDTPVEPIDLSKRQTMMIRRFTLIKDNARPASVIEQDKKQLEFIEFLNRLRKERFAESKTQHLETLDQQKNLIADAQTVHIQVPSQQKDQVADAETLHLRAISPIPQSVSPELAELLQRRERVATQETQRVQAFVAASEKEEKTSPHPAISSSTEAETEDEAETEAETEQEQKTKQSLGQIAQSFGKSLFRRRVPVLHQISMVECGAACLAMLLSYYGRKTSISEVREHCGVGRDGLSAFAIVKAARSYGMRVQAVSLEENDFKFVTLPAIVHWEFNHFIIVEHWTPKHVDVVDPASGRRRMTAEEFDNGFTGVAVMVEPGVNFSRENALAQVSLRTYLANIIQVAPGSFLQVLGASLLLQLLGLVFPLLSKVAIDDLIPMKMLDGVMLFGIGMLIVVLTQLVILLLRSSLLLYVQARVDTHMMFNFFERLFSLPQRFFLQRSSGDIMARVASNVAIRDTVSNQLFSTVLDGSFVIIYLLILVSQSLVITAVVLVIAIVQAVLLLSTQQYARELTRQSLITQGKSQGYIAEALAGIITLKAAGAEQRAFDRLANLFLDQMNVSVRSSYLAMIVNSIMSTLGIIAPLLLLWLGTIQVINGSMQVGTMLALNALGASVLGPLSSLVLSFRNLQLVRAHLERVADVLEAEPEQDIHTVMEPPRLSGQIRLDRVNFQYDPNSPPILKDINLDIHPGQKVAIVGRTGSGKSTLGKLLLGLYLPTEGEIYYDGIPLRSLRYQAVRAQFGVVMQEASVFSGPIRENIALNNPAMSMEQVIQAAQAADIHEDILQMPMEYETFVSEGGSALSGGQRQRLALARALANDPVLMLMDEATSSLDVATERIVEQSINRLSCTQVIIAHRLSTIRNADVILVLHQGQIVERGSHQELIRRNGYYAQLINTQLAAGEIQRTPVAP